MRPSCALPVWIAAVAVVSTLTACASDPGYAPIDVKTRHYFGYTDTPNGAGGYTIRVVLPAGVRDPKSAFAHWERRAAELCAPQAYRKQIAIAQRNMLYVPNGAPAALNYEVVGDAYCEPAAGGSPPATIAATD